MTASLEDRIAAFVADRPGVTAAEVAEHIHRRAADIRRVLNSGAFGIAVDGKGARHYFLPYNARDGQGQGAA